MRDIGNGAIVLGNAINRDHPLNRGLVVHLTMMSGTVGGRRVVDLCRQHNGSISGATWNGYGLKFDGVDDIATFGSGLSVYNSASGEATLHCTLQRRQSTPGTSKQAGFLSIGNPTAASGGASHYPWTNGQLYLGVFNNGTTRPIAAYDDSAFDKTVKHTIAVTNKSGAGNYRLLRNGKLVTSGTGLSGSYFTGTMPTNIGSSNNAADPDGRWFDGVFYDVRIYTRALSDSEIWQLYNESRRGYPTMLNRLSPLRTFYFGTAAGAPPSSTFDVIGGGCGQFMIGAD